MIDYRSTHPFHPLSQEDSLAFRRFTHHTPDVGYFSSICLIFFAAAVLGGRIFGRFLSLVMYW